MIIQKLASRALATQSTAPLCRATGRRLLPTLREYGSAYPSVVDRGFWRSLVPKPLRKENRSKGTGSAGEEKKKKKEWNPATYFIVMFLLVGSMSIQMIALRNETERHMRRAGVRLALLRDVVERIQAGEDVDVDKVLGTGEERREAEWEEVLRSIERDEATRKPANKETESKAAAEAATAAQQGADTPPKKSTGFGNFF